MSDNIKVEAAMRGYKTLIQKAKLLCGEVSKRMAKSSSTSPCTLPAVAEQRHLPSTPLHRLMCVVRGEKHFDLIAANQYTLIKEVFSKIIQLGSPTKMLHKTKKTAKAL